MRTIKHPLSGAVYDLTERGTILVQKDGTTGEFTSDGVWIRGDVKQADPHLCLWIGGKQPGVGQTSNEQSAKGTSS